MKDKLYTTNANTDVLASCENTRTQQYTHGTGCAPRGKIIYSDHFQQLVD